VPLGVSAAGIKVPFGSKRHPNWLQMSRWQLIRADRQLAMLAENHWLYSLKIDAERARYEGLNGHLACTVTKKKRRGSAAVRYSWSLCADLA
jgi:hypothetical protein